MFVTVSCCSRFGRSKDLRIYTTWLACTAQVDCGPGWIPDKQGLSRFDKIREERAEKEKDVCHESMQRIIDSRQGIMNTNSKHYEYLEGELPRASGFSRHHCIPVHTSKSS